MNLKNVGYATLLSLATTYCSAPKKPTLQLSKFTANPIPESALCDWDDFTYTDEETDQFFVVMREEDANCIGLKLLHMYARPQQEQETLDEFHTYAQSVVNAGHALGVSEGQQGRIPIWQAILIGAPLGVASAWVAYKIGVRRSR